MGKIAIKYEVNFKFGVHVMSDLIGLLSVISGDNSITANKAKYYIGLALYKSEHYEDAISLLNAVLPQVEKYQKLQKNIKKVIDDSNKCLKEKKIKK